jgi:hypothetical protein
MKHRFSLAARVAVIGLLLGVGAIGISLLSQQRAHANPSAATRSHGHYQHVLLINIDGFRQADFTDPLLIPDMPNIQSLAAGGVVFTNASTAPLSDSYPGLMNLVTGASPGTTGIYYDVEYSRDLYPPGTTLVGGVPNQPKGTPVNFAENIDLNSDLVGGGGTPGFNGSSVDVTTLPLALKGGKLVPVFPHDYLKVNTIFEVAHEAGLRTAYCDKHAVAYEIVNGPSGVGCDDFYGVESDAFQKATLNLDGSITVVDLAKALGGLKPKSDILVSLGQDDMKFAAVLNQIHGKDSRGNPAPVPALFGTEVLSLSTAEKAVKDHNGLLGGIDGTPGNEQVNALMHVALKHIDGKIGEVIAALATEGLYDSTLIVISAKHGQTPRVGQPNIVNQNGTNVDPFADALEAQGIHVGNDDQDTIINIWLQDQSKTAAALTVLNGLKSNPVLFVDTIYSEGNFPAGFGDPSKDDRTPDMSVRLKPGTYMDNVPSKKRAEHGGVSADETHVVLILAGHLPEHLRGAKMHDPVSTRQAAVTMVEALGLDGEKLQGAAIEHTQPLISFDGDSQGEDHGDGDDHKHHEK